MKKMPFKNQWGFYEIVTGYQMKGNKKKLITKKFGEYVLKHNMVTLELMSASQALERIMDICGIEQDDKFKIRVLFNQTAKPTKRNVSNDKED